MRQIIRDNVRNDNIRERLKLENITERCSVGTGVVWTREETRPRTRWKKYSRDGATWDKKARKPEGEMDGRCQLDMRAIGTTTYEVHNITGWMRIVSVCQSDPTIKWERLEGEKEEVYEWCVHLKVHSNKQHYPPAQWLESVNNTRISTLEG